MRNIYVCHSFCFSSSSFETEIMYEKSKCVKFYVFTPIFPHLKEDKISNQNLFSLGKFDKRNEV